VAVAAALVATQVGLVAYAVGIGPFDRGAPATGPETTPEPGGSEGGAPGGSGGPEVDGGGSASGPPPYELDVLGTERCGNTCRDVTVRLTNNRNATAEGARVWAGRSDVGVLEPGASTTRTAPVSVSYFEAVDVKRKGGWVTIVTAIESEGVTKSFEERRKVA
jgi:hypothetical protein